VRALSSHKSKGSQQFATQGRTTAYFRESYGQSLHNTGKFERSSCRSQNWQIFYFGLNPRRLLAGTARTQPRQTPLASFSHPAKPISQPRLQLQAYKVVQELSRYFFHSSTGLCLTHPSIPVCESTHQRAITQDGSSTSPQSHHSGTQYGEEQRTHCPRQNIQKHSLVRAIRTHDLRHAVGLLLCFLRASN